MPKRITLKAELALVQKANTVLNTELNFLKIETETLHANLAHAQLELLRYSAVIDGEIAWLEKTPGTTNHDRAHFLRKENQPR